MSGRSGVGSSRCVTRRSTQVRVGCPHFTAWHRLLPPFPILIPTASCPSYAPPCRVLTTLVCPR